MNASSKSDGLSVSCMKVNVMNLSYLGLGNYQ